MKYYLRRHYREMQIAENSKIALLEACDHVIGDLAIGWYKHVGYKF